MAVCTTGAEWAAKSAFGPGPLLQIVQAILRTLTSVVIKTVASSLVSALVLGAWPKCFEPAPPIASVFAFRSAKTLRRRFKHGSAPRTGEYPLKLRHRPGWSGRHPGRKPLNFHCGNRKSSAAVPETQSAFTGRL